MFRHYRSALPSRVWDNLPERDIDKTGLCHVKSMYDPEHRRQTGNLDKEHSPLPISTSLSGSIMAYSKGSPNSKEQYNRLKCQEHYYQLLLLRTEKDLLSGRLKLLFIASPNACLLTSLLAVYRPPSCIPLSVRNFLAFRRRSTVARVSRRTKMTIGR
jgi:hypothetical protein